MSLKASFAFLTPWLLMTKSSCGGKVGEGPSVGESIPTDPAADPTWAGLGTAGSGLLGQLKGQGKGGEKKQKRKGRKN